MRQNSGVLQATDSSRFQAYLELTKLRISVMVLLTFAVAAVLEAAATGTALSWITLVWAAVGMFLVAASGNAANMYIERYTDFLMPRTADRPLPSCRLTSTEVALFSAISLGAGSAILFHLANWPTGVCALLNWVMYALVYTPLKRRHWCNTEVGAIAGAMPIIMGALAVSQNVSWINWAFFGVLFFWQFPHFMAIAWKYRDQYQAGGLKMITVTEPTGRAAGQKAVVAALLLLAVSLLPACGARSWIGAALVVVLGLGLGLNYFQKALKFALNRDDGTARSLMLTSLVYLPFYMLALVLGVCF